VSKKKPENATGTAAKKTERHPVAKSAPIIQMIEELTGKQFTGFIKINFTRGSVGKVEKFEEILKK